MHPSFDQVSDSNVSFYRDVKFEDSKKYDEIGDKVLIACKVNCARSEYADTFCSPLQKK